MSATLTLEAHTDCTDTECKFYGRTKDAPKWCLEEAREFRRLLKSKNPKPTGYAWKLWHETTDRAPKPLPKGGVYPAWAWGSPNKLVASILKAAVVPSGWHQQCLDDYAAGTHPWGSAPEVTA
jgi:hypothetical protein